MANQLKWIVTPQESGVKLLSFLIQHLSNQYSARFLKRLIESNQCQINGRIERFATTVLGNGDQICLWIENKHIAPHSFDLERIIFEDDALMVYNKPAGVSCDEAGIISMLKAKRPFLQLVHRLDKNTTGALILAKQPKIFEVMVKQFKQLEVSKRYLAIVDGVLTQTEGMIENYLGKKQDYAGQTLCGSVKKTNGLYACTEWRLLKKGHSASLVACFPKTGRTHQIRIHMAEMGHPILGDFQYGKQFNCSYHPPRYLLHAEEINFNHPISGKRLHLKACVPNDFQNAQQMLF